MESELAPSPLITFLLRWLLFRLMFSSGIVKLLSNGDSWWGLTATTVHFETQCIPSPLAWYLHQLPLPFHKMSTAVMFLIEILIPFYIFAPTRGLLVTNAVSQTLLQILIVLSGNYNFFNWLTVALCISLVDDTTIVSILNLIPFVSTNSKISKIIDLVHRLDNASDSNIVFIIRHAVTATVLFVTGLLLIDLLHFGFLFKWSYSGLISFLKVAMPASIVLGSIYFLVYTFMHLRLLWLSTFTSKGKRKPVPDMIKNSLWALFIIVVSLFIFVSSLAPFAARLHQETADQLPQISSHLYSKYASKYHIVSSYGLFARLTTDRDEIIIEGSNDGKTWKPYEFRYKPGNVRRAPPIVAPHQPRLDWQMWFAPLGSYQQNPWYLSLVGRLLQGSEEVLDLLRSNPFPDHPPQMIRSTLYQYKFTDWNSGKNGTWWRRKPKTEYLPTLTLDNPSLKSFMDSFEPKSVFNDRLVKSFSLGTIPLTVFICTVATIVFLNYRK